MTSLRKGQHEDFLTTEERRARDALLRKRMGLEAKPKKACEPDAGGKCPVCGGQVTFPDRDGGLR